MNQKNGQILCGYKKNWPIKYLKNPGCEYSGHN